MATKKETKDSEQYEYANKASERASRWNRENKERRREIRLKWDKANRDKKKAYRDAHKEEQKEAHRKWRHENWDRLKDVYAERNKAWRKANPVQAQLLGHNRRVNMRGAKIRQEELHNWDSMLCGICAQLIEDKFDIDHIIPISRGGKHEASNLQLAHPTCNTRKHNKLPSELVGVMA